MDHASIAEKADLALRLAVERPQEATVLAREVRAAAIEADLPAEESKAWRALGLAARAGLEIAQAISHLGASVDAAERAGDGELGAVARISLAAALAFAGEGERALATLDTVPTPGPQALLAAFNRASILIVLGRYDEALRCYGPVVRAFRRNGDQLREARSLDNRGVLHVYTGRFPQADADQARAERLFVGLGLLTEAAQVCHNRGFTASRRGDLPAALTYFDRAERRYAEAGVPPRARELDRAEVLLAAGLIHEAQGVAASTMPWLRSAGNQATLAEGLILLADVAYLAGDFSASLAAADEAGTLFRDQARLGWAALAMSASARASLAMGAGSVDGAAQASEAAAALDASGISTRAAEAHFVAGRLWLEAGMAAEADRELRLAASRRDRGPAAGRVTGWHAEAVRRLAFDDRKGALAALRAGLEIVKTQQASLGATELRVHVSIHAAELAGSGLRLAVQAGRPRQILEWMERYRSNSLRTWPVRPPTDEVLAQRLAELRGVASDIAAEVATSGDARPLLRRQAALEQDIRQRHWLASAPSGASASVEGSLDAALAGRALVELADSDGTLHAVVVTDGRYQYRRLGPTAAVLAELDHLRFELRREAYGISSRPGHAAGRLDELLFGALRGLIGARPLVVVPTGALHATPWGALATAAGRAVTVAPSARSWVRSAARPEDGPPGPSPADAVLIVSGPDLPGASGEARALHRIYPDASLLGGRQARAAAVSAALEGAAIAHIAAHASFRADNGLWSALQLADGPLTVYELEALRRPPALVVLSACQSGLSAVRPGDEMLGFVAGLLGVGTRTVIASVVPVDDAGTTPFMVEVHRRLHAGDGPASALAAAQRSHPSALASSFVCFGAG